MVYITLMGYFLQKGFDYKDVNRIIKLVLEEKLNMKIDKVIY